jgi:hypothetical protein
MSKPVVFVTTNDSQLTGAHVAAHSFRRRTAYPERFDVRLLRLEEQPHLLRREGQRYLRKGRPAVWHNADLQSFSPLRRLVPQLMGYAGRALVVDPDVFAVSGEVLDLIDADLHGKAILCRRLPEAFGGGPGKWASSVMLLDCARLTHWRWDDEIDALFERRLDYKSWIELTLEDPATIGELDETWNSFDRLEPGTRLLHMTERRTQPWKTGLPVDFNTNIRGAGGRLREWLRARGLLAAKRYLPHPDPAQEALFFDLMRATLEDGDVDDATVRRDIAARYLRADTFECLAARGWQAPPAHLGR